MRKAAAHALVISYLVITFAGLLYTEFRIKTPLPWPLVRFAYGMMGPYQQYQTYNEELVAEGRLSDGTWERIDLLPYLPYMQGERAVRSYLISFRNAGEDVWPEKYREYARILQRLELKKGRTYESVKLSLERWPVSTENYHALRKDPFLTHQFLVQIP